MHIQAYLYDGYWEDIGTVEAFYEANLALTDNPTPKFRYHALKIHSTLSASIQSPSDISRQFASYQLEHLQGGDV